MKIRFRFSLRTLLLATLFAGSVMLCWSVREPWGFKKCASRFSALEGSRDVSFLNSLLSLGRDKEPLQQGGDPRIGIIIISADADSPKYIGRIDDRYRLNFESKKNAIVWYDERLQFDVYIMTASGNQISLPIAISNDGQYIAFALDKEVLGIWTRRHQNLALWGIYEQPESWLVVGMFGLLLWSCVEEITKDVLELAVKRRKNQ